MILLDNNTILNRNTFFILYKNKMYSSLSNLLGIPYDQAKFISCLFYIFPLGFLNYYIKNSLFRLLYGMISGFLLCFYMYGIGIIHLVVDSLFTYVFIRFYGRKKSAFIVLIFTVLHLSYIHLNRVIYDYGRWSMDVSGIYMMLIAKFSSLAFSYEDGEKDEKELTNDYMKSKKIIERPTFLEMFSYFFHFSSCIIGPSIEFSDFKRFIYFEKEYKDIPFKKVLEFCIRKQIIWIIYCILYIVGSKYFPCEYTLEKEYGDKGIVYQLLYLAICGFVVRTKYYCGWTLSHNAMAFSGLTLGIKSRNTENPDEDNKIEYDFNKGNCFDLKGVELNPSTKVIFTVSIIIYKNI